METVLGPHLVKKDGSTVSTTSALKSKRITLVYYSSHWCGPCRNTTPQLGSWFKGKEGEECEIVFASLDKTPDAFKSYYSSMDFNYALPFGRGEELASTYRVSGIPSLHVFAHGVLVHTKGVEGVLRKAPFPWCWGGELLGKRVRLSGLEKAAHLNGKEGVCVGTVEASHRFTIKVAGEAEAVGVKRERIEIIV